MAAVTSVLLLLATFVLSPNRLVKATDTISVTVEGDPTYNSATLKVTANAAKTFVAATVAGDPASPGTWTLTPGDSDPHAEHTVEGTDLKSSTEYTVTVGGLAQGTGGTVTVDATNNPNNEAETTVCTVGAPLALTLGEVSKDDMSIKVTWTKADGTTNPTMYTLMVGTETIATVQQTADAEYTFTAADAAGTDLQLDTDYKCKIEAVIPAFGTLNACVTETLTDEIDCKISSNAARLLPGLALMISILATLNM